MVNSKDDWDKYRVKVHLELDYEIEVVAEDRKMAINLAKSRARADTALNRELYFEGKWTGEIIK